MNNQHFDIIVIGGGHSGCEASLAAARLEKKTIIITSFIDKIGIMSCNPAIGGIGKGHLVKEIDALGGEMAKIADKTGIHFRTLNKSRGPAVRATRSQNDINEYSNTMKKVLFSQKNLYLIQDHVLSIICKNNTVKGVTTKNSGKIFAKKIILTTGTFLNGKIHLGKTKSNGGRYGEKISSGLSESLKYLGFKLGRFKTGTCPRIDGRTINWNILQEQKHDIHTSLFSFENNKRKLKQISCYITHSNSKTHKVIKRAINKNKAPNYNGQIKNAGPRYCPSIEDKVIRFEKKLSHQIFLEPQGLNSYEIYPNGITTSLSPKYQVKFLKTIKGLENVKITRWGYAVEYEYIIPTQLDLNLQSKNILGLYFAGQINGTTGYEEAAAQGLIAGINASMTLNNKPPIFIHRHQAYIGVLIDDLVTLGISEPYGMFTSRAEHRLLLREDNVYKRLSKIGFECGLINKKKYKKILNFEKKIKKERKKIITYKIKPNFTNNNLLKILNSSTINNSTILNQLLKRPEISENNIKFFHKKLHKSKNIRFRTAIEIKYKGYIKRSEKTLIKIKKLEHAIIPNKLFNERLPGISNEAFEKLQKIKPSTLGQASRIIGITQATLSIIAIRIRKIIKKKEK